MADNFDSYEIAAVITPGAMVTVPLVSEWPELAALVRPDFDLAGLGLFVVLAYVAGHLVQVLGNALEDLLWTATGGMPTERLVTTEQRLVDPEQRDAIEKRLLKKYEGFRWPDEAGASWRALTREIYLTVKAARGAAGVDRHNKQFGMLRGVAAALLVLACWALAEVEPIYALGALGLAAAALVRAHRFGVNYARELFVQYAALPEAGEQGAYEDEEGGADEEEPEPVPA